MFVFFWGGGGLKEPKSSSNDVYLETPEAQLAQSQDESGVFDSA
jgi:hypothetical protein